MLQAQRCWRRGLGITLPLSHGVLLEVTRAPLPRSLPPWLRYPLFLAGKPFVGTFHFKDTHTLVDHTLQEVPADSLRLPPDPL